MARCFSGSELHMLFDCKILDKPFPPQFFLNFKKYSLFQMFIDTQKKQQHPYFPSTEHNWPAGTFHSYLYNTCIKKYCCPCALQKKKSLYCWDQC